MMVTIPFKAVVQPVVEDDKPGALIVGCLIMLIMIATLCVHGVRSSASLLLFAIGLVFAIKGWPSRH